VKFKDSDREINKDSWNNSVSTSTRLMRHILGDDKTPGLTPHPIVDTISVSEARRLITLLSEPLAEIMQDIEHTIRLYEEQHKSIKKLQIDVQALLKKSLVPRKIREVEKLYVPRTVCASEKCRLTINICGDKVHTFPKICHDECTLYGGKKDIVGDDRLKKCKVISFWTKKCKNCGCSYEQHKHIYTDSNIKIIIDEDIFIKENVKLSMTFQMVKNNIMKNLDARKKELENERNLIIESSAKFATYVQANSIAPFNDIFEVR
jgi:hypothetical protein